MSREKVQGIKEKAQKNVKPKSVKKELQTPLQIAIAEAKKEAPHLIAYIDSVSHEIDTKEKLQQLMISHMESTTPAKTIDQEFETAYITIKSEIDLEQFFKKMAHQTGGGVRAIKADYKSFVAVKEKEKKREDIKKLPSLLEDQFKLGYTPYISYFYEETAGILNFVTDNEVIRLCNIFAPVSKITSNINGKQKTYLKMLMKYRGKNVEIIESTRDLVKTDRLANTFGDYGFILDSQRASKIAKYIADFDLDNQYNIKHEKGKLQTGWDNGIFYIPQRDQEVIWLEPNLKKAYTQKGSSQNQKRLIQELAKDKIFINVLGAFASSLFGIVDIMNFFIHNGGLTEGGKSLAVKCALSFFGKPSLMGNNWNTTLNGLETYWEQNHSVPTWIDEMEVSSRVENIIEAVYVFSDGHGKLRAYSKDEEVKQRETKHFKGICFTTGEKSFVEIQNMANNRAKPRGVTGRVLDLNIKDMWSNVNMDLVKDLLDHNHGFLGAEYVAYIEANAEAIKNDYDNTKAFFSDIVDGRKKDQFGLLKLALEIIYKMDLIDKHAYEVQTVNLKYFASLEAEKITTIKDTYTDFVESYTEFIFTNREHFDFKADYGINSHVKTPFYGTVDLTSNTVSIFKKAFQIWCIEHNFVKDQVLETLHDKLKLEVGKGRENYKDKNVKIDGKVMKCYQFRGIFENHVETIYETIKQDQQQPQKEVSVPESSSEKSIEEINDLFANASTLEEQSTSIS